MEARLPRRGKDGALNLNDDLGETKDLAAARPAVVEQLTALMRQYIANGRSTPGEPQKNDAPVALGGGKGRKGGRAEPE